MKVREMIQMRKFTPMKKAKLILVAGAMALMGTTLTGCEKEVCLSCTPIGGGQDVSLCSTDANERLEWQVNRIREGYNCTQTSGD
jgi:hypothetical protein